MPRSLLMTRLSRTLRVRARCSRKARPKDPARTRRTAKEPAFCRHPQPHQQNISRAHRQLMDQGRELATAKDFPTTAKDPATAPRSKAKDQRREAPTAKDPATTPRSKAKDQRREAPNSKGSGKNTVQPSKGSDKGSPSSKGSGKKHRAAKQRVREGKPQQQRIRQEHRAAKGGSIRTRNSQRQKGVGEQAKGLAHEAANTKGSGKETSRSKAKDQIREAPA